jgi:hypothetical protein
MTGRVVRTTMSPAIQRTLVRRGRCGSPGALPAQVRASAGPPYSWGLSVLEDDHKGERLTQATRHTEDSSQACGQPFFVEIEVLDRFANPCSTASVLALGREEDGARDAGE